MKTLAYTALGLLSLTVATEAHAESAQAPFEPTYEQTVAEFPWESAWLPNEDAAVRIQLTAAARQDLQIDMTGHADYDWDAQELIFRGDVDGGEIINIVDLDITANLHVGLLGSNVDSEIGLYNLNREVLAQFTPYLLDGNVDKPVELAQQIGPFNLVEAPFQISDSISGVFVLDFVIDTPGVTFEGTRIDVDSSDSSVFENIATITTENGFAELAFEEAEPGGTHTVYGREHGLLNSELSVRLMPSVLVEIGAGDNPVEVNIGPFDIGVEYPLVEDQEIVFDAIALDFDVPEAPEPETTGGDSSSGGDESTGDAPEPEPEPEGTTGGADEPEGGDETSGGVPLDGFGGAEADGCGCSTTNDAPAAVWTLFGLFGLLGLRR
ncbi:MAG: MYXO-CTERM sorting domain-containing protein, partial [Myxococcota bacterium]